MLPSTQSILYLLVAANIIVYALLFINFIKNRPPKLTYNPTLEEAFAILEEALEQSLIDLPEGYTWSEALVKLKSRELDVDWRKIESIVRKYEEFRYGGVMYENVHAQYILRLAFSLSGGGRIAGRSKIKSVG